MATWDDDRCMTVEVRATRTTSPYTLGYTSNTTPLPAVFLFAARCMSIPDMIVYCKKLIRLVRKPRPWPSSPS